MKVMTTVKQDTTEVQLINRDTIGTNIVVAVNIIAIPVVRLRRYSNTTINELHRKTGMVAWRRTLVFIETDPGREI